MKVLAFFALSAVATAAMAVQPPSTITLNGPSVQMTNSVGTAISNTSGAHNEALQNIASNAGPVQVFAGGSSTQTANLGLGAVTNEAKGDDALASKVTETLKEMDKDGFVKDLCKKYADYGISYDNWVLK